MFLTKNNILANYIFYTKREFVIDLIILALITFFIIRKLKSILGEESDEIYFGYNTRNVNEIKDAETIGDDYNGDDKQFDYLSSDAKMNVRDISRRIENFSLNTFKRIAEKALEMVLKANSEQNKVEIRRLLSKDLADLVCKSFEDGERNNIFLVSLKETKILDVIKTNNIFDIKIMFNMEQINYRTDVDNNIVDGSKNEVISVQEIWTFTHNFDKKDSTWFVSVIEEL